MTFDIIGPVLEVVNSAIERFLPKKMDETDKERFKNEMTKYILNNAFKENESFRQFILEYEGRSKDLPRFVQVIRALIRPVLTILISGTYIWGWLHPERFTAEQMAVLKPLALIVLLFWFGDRAIQKSGILEVFKRKEK